MQSVMAEWDMMIGGKKARIQCDPTMPLIDAKEVAIYFLKELSRIEEEQKKVKEEVKEPQEEYKAV
jgi:hypothetical protein